MRCCFGLLLAQIWQTGAECPRAIIPRGVWAGCRCGSVGRIWAKIHINLDLICKHVKLLLFVNLKLKVIQWTFEVNGKTQWLTSGYSSQLSLHNETRAKQLYHIICSNAHIYNLCTNKANDDLKPPIHYLASSSMQKQSRCCCNPSTYVF